MTKQAQTWLLVGVSTTLLWASSPAIGQSTTTYKYDALGHLTDVQSSAGTSAAYTFDAADNRVTVNVTAGHRYWRIRTDNTTAGGYFGMIELEMRSQIGGSDITAGKTITGSATYPGYPASQAIDDNGSTFWTTGGAGPPSGGHWVSIDFTSPVDVREVLIQVRPDQYREDPRSFYVEYSDSGTTWVTYWSISGIPAWSASETRVFSKP